MASGTEFGGPPRIDITRQPSMPPLYGSEYGGGAPQAFGGRSIAPGPSAERPDSLSERVRLLEAQNQQLMGQKNALDGELYDLRQRFHHAHEELQSLKYGHLAGGRGGVSCTTFQWGLLLTRATMCVGPGRHWQGQRDHPKAAGAGQEPAKQVPRL